MALDTSSKRASAVSIGQPFLLAIGLPDGTVSAGDRQHLAWSYSGIAASVAGVVAATIELTLGVIMGVTLRLERG